MSTTRANISDYTQGRPTFFVKENLEAYLAFMDKWQERVLSELWDTIISSPDFAVLPTALDRESFVSNSHHSHQQFVKGWETNDWENYNQFVESSLREIEASGLDHQLWAKVLIELRELLPGLLKEIYADQPELQEQIIQAANGVAEFTLYTISTVYLKIRNAEIESERTRSRKALSDLRHSEEKLKAVFKSTSDHLIVVDREARITMINHTAPGLRVSDVMGKQIYDYQDEQTQQKVSQALDTVFTDGVSVEYETEYFASPSQKHVYSNAAAPIKGRGGEINEAVIISRDVTKTRQLEKERSGLFEVIKRSLNEIFMFDAQDLKFQFVNEGALKNLGYSLSEITELTPLDIKPEHDQETFSKLLEILKESDDKKIKFETVHRRKDGSNYDVEVHLQLVHYQEGEIYLAVINDITERNENQRRLNQSLNDLRNVQERLELSIEGSWSGLWDWNLQTDELFFSSRFKRLLGYEPHEFEDNFQSFYNAIHRSDRRRVLQAITDSLDNIRPFDITYRLQLKDGHYRWFIARASVLFSEEKVPLRMAGSIADIDERVQAELQLENMNRNLEKMVDERTAELQVINKELESFSYSVSHDLRTPLRAISGFAKILAVKAKDNLDEEQQKFLKVIRDNVTSMDQLIEDLLGYAKMGRANVSIKQIDMHRLVNEVLDEILDPEEADKVIIRVEELPKIKADRELMKRVWSNLISNAIKFSSEKEQPEIKISANNKKDEVVYCVKDNGAGFNMRYANKLFSIFKRLHTQKEFPGTGVGLAIVQRIILKHGGEVWAESKPNKGATFSFSIPKHILIEK